MIICCLDRINVFKIDVKCFIWIKYESYTCLHNKVHPGSMLDGCTQFDRSAKPENHRRRISIIYEYEKCRLIESRYLFLIIVALGLGKKYKGAGIGTIKTLA